MSKNILACSELLWDILPDETILDGAVDCSGNQRSRFRHEHRRRPRQNTGKWVADLGYKGVQIPTWDARVIDLDKAAESQTYCDELKGKLVELGLQPTELAAHL